MARKSLYFLTAILLLQLVPISHGQNITPDVDVECSQPTPIDVYPGATRSTIIYCLIQNSNPYDVKVEFTYEAELLTVAGPDSVTVGAGSEMEIQVSVRAALRQPAGSHQASITYQVTEASGVPVSEVTQQKEINVVVLIKQFSRLRVSSEQSLVKMDTGNEVDLEYSIYNDGNARDKFILEIANIEDLESSGWSVISMMSSVEIDSMAPPEKVAIKLMAPPTLVSDDVEILINGSRQIFEIEFKVTSEYSVRTEGIPNYEIADTRIIVYEENDSIIPRSLPFPSIIFAVLAICSAALFSRNSRF